ncbi:MAG TPA: hypothetical protein VGG03_27725 [Thermoanaerobaculia bacterium]|jgi:hypothetical protein
MRSAVILLLASFALPLAAQPTDPVPPSAWEPLFFGYGTDPEMDFGGRTVMSLQSVLSRAFGSIADAGERHPGLAPAWEFPVAAAVLLVQHEVGGHGGRGRELGLSPSYAFNYDFSAATGTARPPRTNEGNALIGAGGTEADNVMAHRALMDLLRPEGADGAKVPLAFMSKLDLTVYVLGTENPDREEDFGDQYRDGNDIAYYLLSRQAQRLGADPTSIWSGNYGIVPDEPLLHRTYDDARATAIWNLLDPSLVGAAVNYFREHVLGGSVRVHAPVVRAGGMGLTLGTRGALGPQEVSRFLDLYAATRRGVFTVYVRDLDSSIDRAWGFGAGVHALKLGRSLELGLAADAWDEPDSREATRTGSGWNAAAAVDAFLGERWGLAAKAGSKSDGFFPGLPLEDGVYLGFGVRAVW